MRFKPAKSVLIVLSVCAIAAVPPTPAQRHAIDYRIGEVQVCGAIDELEPDVQQRCLDERREFSSGEKVCVYTRFANPGGEHRHRVVAWRDGEEQFVRDDAGAHVDSWRVDEEWWAYCEPDPALPGNWRFDLFADIGRGFELVGSRSFAVRAEQLYEVGKAETCAEVRAAADGWQYECTESKRVFAAGERAHMVAEFRNVIADHRFRVETRRDGRLVRTQTTDWNRVHERWHKSFLVPEVETAPGRYEFVYSIDTGNGFERVGSRRFAVGVRAPVLGPVRNQCHWPQRRGVWAICKHRRGGPHAPHGVAFADDSAAWDINLRDYEDAGKPVYPMAPGRIVRFGGPGSAAYNGAAGVLVEHETADGERWWSAYLHMQRDSIAVREGQMVDVDTPLGRIGRTGTTNSHLHAVAYRGENRKGGLRSFEALIVPRTEPVQTARRAAPAAGKS